MTPPGAMNLDSQPLERSNARTAAIRAWTRLLSILLACAPLSPALAETPDPLEESRQILLSINLSTDLAAEQPERLQGKTLQGRLQARPLRPVDDEEAIAQELQIPGQAELLLPCSTPWEVSLEAPGHWARTERLEPCEGQAERQIQVLAAGTISGQLLFPEKALQELSIQLETAPNASHEEGSTALQPSRQTCPIVEGRWTCVVPAEKLDIRLAAGDYIPQYFWDVVVERDKETDLGTHRLERGASLAGWVSWHDVPAMALRTEIKLTPKRFGWHRDANERRHLAAMKLHTAPTDRGFFQFHGLQAGEYRLSANTAGAAAEGADITLLDARETQLEEPLVLKPPVEVEVFFEPPADPLGRPWLISVSQMDSTGILNIRIELEESGAGVWSTLDLEPGQYLLSLGDLSGSHWIERWLTIAPGMRPVFIEVPVVAIHGRLSLGDTPLQGTVVFGSTQGQEQIKITSDEEGKFEGYLPREGTWPVDLVLEEGGMVNQALGPVEVRLRPGQSKVFLEIELPDTRLEGVVMADDQPVPRARMAIVRDGEEKSRDAILLTDDDGEFELLGLSPGTVHVHAYYRGRTSPWVEVELREDTLAPSLRLILQAKIEFSGLVLSPTGPVPGAEVAVWPTLADGSFRLLERAATGIDGSFTVEVPEGTVRADLLVMAPGFAHQMLAVMVSPGEPPGPQIIQVEPGHGTLVLAGTEPQQGLPAAMELHYKNSRFPLDLLIRMLLPKRKAIPTPGGFGLLQMAPGEYRLCIGTSSSCSGGFLASGDELRLGGEDSENLEGELSKGLEEDPPQSIGQLWKSVFTPGPRRNPMPLPRIAPGEVLEWPNRAAC